MDTRRKLVKASLEVVLMSLLADGPIHGYLLAQRFEESTGQSIGWSSLYPALQSMQKKGWLRRQAKIVDGRERQIYSLTQDGLVALRYQGAQWAASLARLQGQVLPAIRRAEARMKR